MEKSFLLCFSLVAAILCDEDVIQLLATEESQTLTSPSLEGIARPHDFKWRIWLNTTEPSPRLIVTLHYLNVPETINCSGSYLEIVTGNHSMERRCTEVRDELFFGWQSYVDVTYHVESDYGKHEFQMSYVEDNPEIGTCIGPFRFPLWEMILITVLILCFIIITCCCVKRHCRRQNQKVAKRQNNGAEPDKQLAFIFTGPPSYEDVTKGDQPPSYSSVVHA